MPGPVLAWSLPGRHLPGAVPAWSQVQGVFFLGNYMGALLSLLFPIIPSGNDFGVSSMIANVYDRFEIATHIFDYKVQIP